MAISSDDRRQPSVQIANALRADIQNEKYRPGDRLPTVEQLATDYGVAKATVQRSLQMLRDEGYLVSWQGRGIYVRDVPPPGQEAADADSNITHRLEEMCTLLDELGHRVERLEAQVQQLGPPAGAAERPGRQGSPRRGSSRQA